MEHRSDRYIFPALVLISIFFLISNTFHSVILFKNTGLKFLVPASQIAEYPISKATKIYERVQILTSLIDENKKIKEENEKLKKEYRDMLFIKESYNRLLSSLNIQKYEPGNLKLAKILFHPPERYFSELTISGGKSGNIKKDMPAVTVKDGKWALQGRIDEALNDYSRVRLVTSPEFKAGAEVSGGYRGVIQGNDSWELTLKYITPNAALKKGDIVYTSGTGGIFPPGLIIGKIKEIKELDFSIGLEASVEVYSYPQNTSYLYILIREPE